MATTNRTWTGHVFIGVSLDGLIARPDGDLDWLTDPRPGPRHAAITSSRPVDDYATFSGRIDHLVMGRGTYEKVLGFGAWPYPGRPVIVLSMTLSTDDARITIARSVDEVVRMLADSAAQHVYIDGGQVIQAFLRADLIDEIDIAWAPVLIGKGMPLFGELGRDVQLVLRAMSATDDGMVHASYVVHRA